MRKLILVAFTLIVAALSSSVSARAPRVTQSVDFSNISDVITLAPRSLNILEISNIPSNIRRLRVRNNGQKKIKQKRRVNVKNGSARLKFRTGNGSSNDLFILVTQEKPGVRKDNLAVKLNLPEDSNCGAQINPVCGLLSFVVCRNTSFNQCASDDPVIEAVNFNNQCELERAGATLLNSGPCL